MKLKLAFMESQNTFIKLLKTKNNANCKGKDLQIKTNLL